MDRTKRRTLLLLSSAGMLVSVGFITLSLNGYISKSITLFFAMLFVAFFEIGLGPIPWLIVAGTHSLLLTHSLTHLLTHLLTHSLTHSYRDLPGHVRGNGYECVLHCQLGV